MMANRTKGFPKASREIVNPYAKKRAREDDVALGLADGQRRDGNKDRWDEEDCEVVVALNDEVASLADADFRQSNPPVLNENDEPPGVALSSTLPRSRSSADLLDGSTTSSSASALVIAASDKAGMEGIDRKKIDQIILRASGNSMYMQQQRKRDEKVNARIAELRKVLERRAAQKALWRRHLEEQIDQEVPAIISQRSPRSTCVVVDMDMFYMACEMLERPELVDKPACVGRNMITTSNYVARKYGVRSAMAGYIGDRLVQELSNGQERLIHVPHNFELYRQKSETVRGVLAEYDPSLSAFSLDEAYLDLAEYLARRLEHPEWNHNDIKASLIADQQKRTEGDGHDSDVLYSTEAVLGWYSPSTCMNVVADIVREMRHRVFQETRGLTCSAGIAPNFMLAKIASNFNKPNGQLLVEADHDKVISFLHPLPVRKVSGIGRVQEKILNAFSIVTVKDLYEQRALVRLLFSPTTANFLLRASLGCSSSGASSSSVEDTGQKGISRERTFQPLNCWSEINVRMEDICSLLSDDMKRKSLRARTVTVKAKLLNYDVLSKSRSLGPNLYVQASRELAQIATELLRDIRREYEGSQFSVRLLGLRCSNFGSSSADDSFEMPQGSPLREVLNVTVPTRAPQPTLDRFLRRKRLGNSSCRNELGSGTSELPMLVSCPETCSHRALGTVRNDKAFPSHCVSFGQDDQAPRVAVPRVGISADHRAVHTSMESFLVTCPLCGKVFNKCRNIALNQHIDACLNAIVARKVVEEETTRSVVPRPKKMKQTIADFFRSRTG
jgi:DNA polymerase kappa